MKISYKDQTNEHKNSEMCVVRTPNIQDETIDFAIATISGRYPAEKRVTNQACKEMVYVHEGSGKIVVDGKENLLSAGDVILLEPGEKFYWEGHMSLFISCRPAWHKEQHFIVD